MLFGILFEEEEFFRLHGGCPKGKKGDVVSHLSNRIEVVDPDGTRRMILENSFPLGYMAFHCYLHHLIASERERPKWILH